MKYGRLHWIFESPFGKFNKRVRIRCCEFGDSAMLCVSWDNEVRLYMARGALWVALVVVYLSYRLDLPFSSLLELKVVSLKLVISSPEAEVLSRLLGAVHHYWPVTTVVFIYVYKYIYITVIITIIFISTGIASDHFIAKHSRKTVVVMKL